MSYRRRFLSSIHREFVMEFRAYMEACGTLMEYRHGETYEHQFSRIHKDYSDELAAMQLKKRMTGND